MSREGVGVAVILAGILVIIGAAKGTWRTVWSDLTGQAPPSGAGSGAFGGGSSTISGGGATVNPNTGQWVIHNPLSPFPSTPFNPTIPLPGNGGFQPLSYQDTQPTVLPYTPTPGSTGYPLVTAV